MLHVPPESNEFEAEIIPCSDFRLDAAKLKLKPLMKSAAAACFKGYHKQYAPKPLRDIVPTAVLTQSKRSKSPIRWKLTRKPSSRTSISPPIVNVVQVPVSNPQLALQDKGVIDSGCSRHMTRNMSYLFGFEELNGGYVAFEGNPKGGKITGKGKIKTSKLNFDNVYFIKELKFNLFSVSQMCDKKNSVLFTDTECLVLSSYFKLPDESQALLKVPRENHTYNVNLKNIVPSGDLTCLFAKATLNESNLWHRRLAHVNFKTRNKLVKGNLVRGLPTKVFENDHTFVACKKGKQHRASCKTKPVCSVDQPIFRLHIALFGLTFVKSLSTGPTWLFDIDSLSGTMNYHPNTTRKQTNSGAGFQDTLDGKKVREEVDLSYILFLVWSSVGSINPQNNAVDAAFDGKEHDFNVQKPKSKVILSLSSSAQSMDQDDKTMKEANGKIHVESVIGYRDLNADAAGLSNTAVSPTYGDDSQFYDDLDMPGLEDIIYSDDEDAVDPVADFNNLEPSILVSPIPTTSTHKDHPISQIIGDLSSTTQTRSMTIVVTDQGGLLQMFGNDFHTCMFACFLSHEEPKRVHQALKNPSWIEAIQEELLQFMIQKVWVLVDLPYRKRAIGTKWVSRNKKDERGIVIRYKARLVAQGHTQEDGIDYNEVFAPVARIEAIRLFLAYASFMGFMVYQMDVKSAFLYSTIEKEVAWYETLATYLLENSFQRGTIDQTLFIKKQKGHILLVQIYVDDIIFGATNKDLCRSFEKLMKDKFQISSMGELTFFLGLQVKQKEDGIFISQDKYVAKILRKFGLTEGKLASTPIDTEKPLLKDPDGEDETVVATSSTEAEYVAVASCCPQFWNTVTVKQSADITMLQALVDKKKVLISEVVIRDVLRLDDAEGVDCLPNEEIFTGLARMGYEKPSTKLTFYKPFFSSQWKFLIHTILQSLSAKRMSWNEFSSTMASDVICLSTGRKFNFSKYIFDSLVRNIDSGSKFYMYPRFIHQIIQNRLGDLSTHTTKYISPALTQKVFANMRRVGKGFSGVKTPLFEGMLVVQENVVEGIADEQVQDDVAVTTAPEDVTVAVEEDIQAQIIPSPAPPTSPPPPQDIPSTSHVPSTSPQPHSPTSAQPQGADFLTSLLQEALDACAAFTRRVKHLEHDKRIESSDDTIIEDVINQGRLIDELDRDESKKQAEIYQIDMDHAIKVLSMHEEELKEVQELVEVVTTAKLLTEVVIAASAPVSAASTIIPAAKLNIPAVTITTAPVKVAAASTRRIRGVVNRDPEEESIVEMDEAYARKLHEELNEDIDWDVTIDHVKQKAKVDPFIQRYQVMKKRPQTKAQARRNMIMYLKNTARFKLD
uniref:Uncharacterized protein n=1 Tax=Tanacetum cinerariifolium TaxID=118510 RepID=A0A699GRP2_TANCI|nr:hypothetical protein [Tanacetum cinerariifolium]